MSITAIAEAAARSAAELTPSEIVAELDKYIIGQEDAKRAVAIALRNRHRRSLLPPDIKEDVIPKNILMIGPTGVGKTEIARRLAKLANAPFVKVEATKFTEVGYVGRDVDSMVRDLMQTSVRMVEEEVLATVMPEAEKRAIDRILDQLEPMEESSGQEHAKEGVEIFFQRMGQLFGQNPPQDATAPAAKAEDEYQRDQEREQRERKKRIRAKLRKQLESGTLDDQFVEVEVEESSMTMWQGFSPQGMEEMVFDMRDMLGSSLPKRRRTKRARISEAKKILAHEEAQKMIDRDDINRIAQQRAQEHGIIFIDEIDKVVAKGSGGSGPDVSREGVQRDLLPVIEGSTVFTKYGSIDTRHILFIAAGAFHNAKPSDLIPELQGRLPIRVELQQLTEENFAQILLEPRTSLIKQYQALLRTEGVELEFTEDAIGEIAKLAAEVNAQTENIGARRLHTMLERLLEEVSFGAPDKMTGPMRIDAAYVRSRLADAAGSQDLSRYIL